MSVDAVQERVIWEDETTAALRAAGLVGERLSGDGGGGGGGGTTTFETLKVTGADVVIFPAASRACAVRV